MHFSRLRSKGSRFTLGVWGLRRPLPFATVGCRSQPSAWSRYPRSVGECCKSGHFWRFQTSRNLVSWSRRGTSWFQHVSSRYHVSKVQAPFASFSDDDLHFSWQAQHFGCVHLHFTWLCCGILGHVMKIGGSLPRNISFEVAPTRKPRRKT